MFQTVDKYTSTKKMFPDLFYFIRSLDKIQFLSCKLYSLRIIVSISCLWFVVLAVYERKGKEIAI